MAMNFSEEEKKKMLEDESEIYQKRDDGLDANNGQLKKLKGREKRAYFRQYYLGTVAVVIVVAILAVLFFKNAVQKKPHCVLYIAIEDDVLDEDKVADFEKAVEKYLNIDTKNERATRRYRHIFIQAWLMLSSLRRIHIKDGQMRAVWQTRPHQILYLSTKIMTKIKSILQNMCQVRN